MKVFLSMSNTLTFRTGIVFDIREFTIHDGPGLRTTVFMKGCPLRCAWCHNPEGLSSEPQVLQSPAGDRIVGRTYRCDELAEILNRQGPVLRSGGGVTFSGGEALLQAAFVAEVIDQLDDLHVVLDTSGYASDEDFLLVTEKVDLVLFDLKLIDPQEHLRWTGVDNSVILENLHTLSGIGVPFIIRVPLVPQVTNNRANLRSIINTVHHLPGLERVELLPYNYAAGGKYAACGLTWQPGFDESQANDVDPNWFSDFDIEVCVI
jgi:pyruvate formate lyase activating enzyme